MSDAPMNTPEPEVSEQEPGQMQFGIRTMLVLTVMASLMASFLREYGTHGFVVVASTLPIAILIGWTFGQIAGDVKIRVYWAVVAATLFQIITSNVFMLRYWDYFVWPIFAALAGGLISSPVEYVGKIRKLGVFNSTTRMLLGMLVGMLVYGLYALILWLTGAESTWQTAEFAAYTAAGIFIGLLIEACIYTDKKFNISQLYVAFSLVVLAIIFATFAASLIPGW